MISEAWPVDDPLPALFAVAAGGPADRATFARHPLYPKQAAIADDPARFVVTEAATKSGKTMSHIEWMLESGFSRGYGHSWWVATVATTADIAFRRMQDRLRGYIDSGHGPVRVADRIPFARNMTERWLEAGGVRYWFKSADKADTLYGDDVYDLVGDEITRWKEDSWIACFTTLTATEGRARLIGNVKGRRNFAYRLARKAEAGEPGWSYHRLTYLDAVEAGVITDEAVEAARRTLPAAEFRQLFLAEPSDDEGNPFGVDAIAACVTALSDAEPVAWGWDLAKSVDWTVGIALDAAGNVCRLERWQRSWADTLRLLADAVGRVPALIDSTGVGDPVVEQLQRGSARIEGYKFTSPSKQQLMEGLAVAIQRREIGYPAGVLVAELEAFEYEYTRSGVRYSAPDGMHDDCVCALALAVEAWRAQQRKRAPRLWYPGMERTA